MGTGGKFFPPAEEFWSQRLPRKEKSRDISEGAGLLCEEHLNNGTWLGTRVTAEIEEFRQITWAREGSGV